VLTLPQTQDYVAHFLEGVRIEDLATQMRMGEYKDAFILIGRYPWLGVGFSGSPDIDTYIGVANVYLLIAEQMGLVGLASFLVVMGVFFVRFWRTRALAAAEGSAAPMDSLKPSGQALEALPESGHLDAPELEPLWWGLHAGLIGLLVGGIVDHYFFNPDFPHSVALFWLVVGLATATTDIIRRRAGE
jgi:O-antigen ligase